MIVKKIYIFVYLTVYNKMEISFLPKLSKKPVKSVMKFLKKCAKSKYSHDREELNYILEQIERFFQFRIESFTSMDALLVMKTIARYFCFVSDLTDFALCTWDELVRMVFFIVPSIRIVNKKLLCFKHKKTVFIVRKCYYHDYACEELTFNLTIIE
jgi:hypothetical protein